MTGTGSTGTYVDDDPAMGVRRPNELRALSALAAACEEVPLLEGATHCFVSATITNSPSHPLGRLRGWLKPTGRGSETSSARDLAPA